LYRIVFSEAAVSRQLVRPQDLVDAQLYESEDQVIQDALRHLFSNRPDLRISVAVHRYRTDEKLSLDQAATLAGVSLERIKEILERSDVPLRLGRPSTSIGEARAEYAGIAAMPSLFEIDAEDVARIDSEATKLEDQYIFRDVAVRRFLQVHPHLIEFLLDAFPHLQKHFGPSPRVELEVIHDPEIGPEGELIAYILTPLSVDKAQARLDRLDDEWLLDELDRVDGLLNFSLEFI
jgi:predicted HTH domain antitoxin